MSISDRICELLNSPKCQGKSQNEIASEIGIASSVITKIKQGKSTDPSAGTIYAISKYFGVSADWILGLPSPDMEEMNDVTAAEQIGCSRGTYETLKRIFSGVWMDDENENIFPMFLEEISEDFLLAFQNFFIKSKELSKMEFEDHKRCLEFRTKRFNRGNELSEELKKELKIDEKCLDQKREEEKPELKRKKEAVHAAELQIHKNIILILENMADRIDRETNGERHSVASYLFAGGTTWQA